MDLAAFSLDKVRAEMALLPAVDETFNVGCIVHGIGMCNEYPQISPLKRFERTGYDGAFAKNMTVPVESYIGEVGGHEGVKLEQMVRITETGVEPVAPFPFEEELLA